MRNANLTLAQIKETLIQLTSQKQSHQSKTESEIEIHLKRKILSCFFQMRFDGTSTVTRIPPLERNSLNPVVANANSNQILFQIYALNPIMYSENNNLKKNSTSKILKKYDQLLNCHASAAA